MNMSAYELHPLCVLFPRLIGIEFDALREDILANGQREPIVLHDGLILDGGNRYRACIEAGVEPEFVQFAGGNLWSFVKSANLHRRHLSPGQQAAIVASAQDWSTAQVRGGDRKSDQSAMLHLDSVASRAAESGASVRTQKMADKVAKADPELAVRVGHGEVSLPKAHADVGGTPKPKPKKEKSAKATPAAPASDELQAALAQRDERIVELQRLAREINADNASMAKVFEADEELVAAMAENKRLRAEVVGLRERVNGLMNEKSEAIRLVKYWKKKAQAGAAA